MALNIEPAVAMVPASGGVSNHAFTNLGKQHLMKATNNDNYYVKPVSGSRAHMTSPKRTSLWVQFAAASPEENDNKNWISIIHAIYI
uniref:Uncharacterized protein n=1 Tax=Acrobeloides nanus TaxID=290746 RepID=A0A914C559_9BILA